MPTYACRSGGETVATLAMSVSCGDVYQSLTGYRSESGSRVRSRMRVSQEFEFAAYAAGVACPAGLLPDGELLAMFSGRCSASGRGPLGGNTVSYFTVNVVGAQADRLVGGLPVARASSGRRAM